VAEALDLGLGTLEGGRRKKPESSRFLRGYVIVKNTILRCFDGFDTDF
jgi:hypothetical protein